MDSSICFSSSILALMRIRLRQIGCCVRSIIAKRLQARDKRALIGDEAVTGRKVRLNKFK